MFHRRAASEDGRGSSAQATSGLRPASSGHRAGSSPDVVTEVKGLRAIPSLEPPSQAPKLASTDPKMPTGPIGAGTIPLITIQPAAPVAEVTLTGRWVPYNVA